MSKPAPISDVLELKRRITKAEKENDAEQKRIDEMRDMKIRMADRECEINIERNRWDRIVAIAALCAEYVEYCVKAKKYVMSGGKALVDVRDHVSVYQGGLTVALLTQVGIKATFEINHFLVDV